MKLSSVFGALAFIQAAFASTSTLTETIYKTTTIHRSTCTAAGAPCSTMVFSYSYPVSNTVTSSYGAVPAVSTVVPPRNATWTYGTAGSGTETSSSVQATATPSNSGTITLHVTSTITVRPTRTVTLSDTSSSEISYSSTAVVYLTKTVYPTESESASHGPYPVPSSIHFTYAPTGTGTGGITPPASSTPPPYVPGNSASSVSSIKISSMVVAVLLGAFLPGFLLA